MTTIKRTVNGRDFEIVTHYHQGMGHVAKVYCAGELVTAPRIDRISERAAVTKAIEWIYQHN